MTSDSLVPDDLNEIQSQSESESQVKHRAQDLNAAVQHVQESPLTEKGDPGERRYRILYARETVRGRLANGLLYLLIGTAFGALSITVLDHVGALLNSEKEPEWEMTKDVISLLLTSNSALAGAALGFYFGDKGSSTES